jgi:hypothetical protein
MNIFPLELILSILEFINNVNDVYNFSNASKDFQNAFTLLLSRPTTIPIGLIKFAQENHRRDNRKVAVYYANNIKPLFLSSILSYRQCMSYANCFLHDNKLIFRNFSGVNTIYDPVNNQLLDIDQKYKHQNIIVSNKEKWSGIDIKGFNSCTSTFYFVSKDEPISTYVFSPFKNHEKLFIKSFRLLRIISVNERFPVCQINIANDTKHFFKITVNLITKEIICLFLGKSNESAFEDIHSWEDERFCYFRRDKFVDLLLDKSYKIQQIDQIFLSFKSEE